MKALLSNYFKKLCPISSSPQEDQKENKKLHLPSETKRFAERFALSTRVAKQVLIREETLDGETSSSSYEVDSLTTGAYLEHCVHGNFSKGFYSGKRELSSSSSESSCSQTEENPLALTCEENIGEGMYQ